MEADLVLFHYGKCDEAERQRVSRHLAKCANCRAFLEDLGTLPGRGEAADPPPAFWADYSMEVGRKLNALDDKRVSARLLSFLPAWPVPALGVAMLVILALSFVLARGLWHSEPSVPEEQRILEVAPLVQDMDFFRAMPYLEAMDKDQSSLGERWSRPV